jgi:hypothetical protein
LLSDNPIDTNSRRDIKSSRDGSRNIRSRRDVNLSRDASNRNVANNSDASAENLAIAGTRNSKKVYRRKNYSNRRADRNTRVNWNIRGRLQQEHQNRRKK